MKLIKITNPIYKLLKKIIKFKASSLIVESNYVRDSNKPNKVFFKKKNNVFFLQKSVYRKQDIYKKLFKDNKKKDFFNLNINNKKFTLKIIDDESRRYNQFKFVIKNRSVLDYGSGYGDFLRKFKKNRVAAIEKRDDCITFLKKKKIQTYEDISSIKDKFDFITFFNSIDHLEYPDHTLKKIKRNLNKNGKIIIEVPNANNILYKLNIAEFKNFSFCQKHLIIHSEKSLTNLLKYSGYQVEKTLYFQRYNLNNHINWILNKKPGGHTMLKNLVNIYSNENYKNLLIEKKLADTLIIIAKPNVKN